MIAMFATYKFFFFVILAVSTCYGLTCNEEYNATKYIGKSRVPVDCKEEKLDCPHSWKSGVPNISGDSSDALDQQIDTKFLNCKEGFLKCGYVPINPSTGEVLGNSGVTIGAGVDLGNKTRASFNGVTSEVVTRLQPYFGLQKDTAACAIIENPFQLTREQAKNVTSVIKTKIVQETKSRYDRDRTTDSTAFDFLPRGVRTAIVSVWFQFGYPQAYPKFWKAVTANDWKGAVKELRNFYKNPDAQLRGDLIRRNDEADLIEATFSNCSRPVDLVFLLDESGSVQQNNFQKCLDFVKNVIKSFPDENLTGKNGARFGLSTFSFVYSSHFHLNDYTTQSEYSRAISSIAYRSGETLLGAALQRILIDQFTTDHGLRPTVDGIPRILIVLTDGKSHDSITAPAKIVKNNEIIIYAIGIANHDITQLKKIASSNQHVFTLSSFSNLNAFISTITSSACYEPLVVAKNETTRANVKKGANKYFIYKVKLKLNLKLDVKDLQGSTILYVSRTTPHPYRYNYDLKFERASQKDKVIVISASATTRRSKRSSQENLRPIYISVTSNSDSAEFEIKANECDPSVCVEGTNERNTASSKFSPNISFTFIITITVAFLSFVG